ncbi:MAG TPA: hypothetical protein VFB12_05065 [Ktedonobacteraceae bacterium]|nr:hypothetical protein [Ktedonobacteraceae bacterium]
MAILFAVVLGVLALAFVLYPLYRRKVVGEQATTAQAGETNTLTEREQAARGALQEVELDYQLGNIDEPDYRDLRERYMQRALVALKSRFEREQEIDEEIEERLRQLKEQENNDVAQ